MKLIVGKKYDGANICCVGWQEGGQKITTPLAGYNCWDYFDDWWRYLGPDTEGIEPIFEYTSE